MHFLKDIGPDKGLEPFFIGPHGLEVIGGDYVFPGIKLLHGVVEDVAYHAAVHGFRNLFRRIQFLHRLVVEHGLALQVAVQGRGRYVALANYFHIFRSLGYV